MLRWSLAAILALLLAAGCGDDPDSTGRDGDGSTGGMPTCGNSIAEGDEPCDGDDLGGRSCA